LNLWVNGIVAARNKQPYVILSKDEVTVAQLSIAEARKIALDLLRAASYAEADAMILRFFEKAELPENAAGALLVEFRDFRHGLDMEKVSGSVCDPDTGEQK
jgi:hypothetical protein